MTDNEIIKALESCFGAELCSECPYEEYVDCVRQKEKDAIELIKRLQEDNAAKDETIKNLIEQIKTLAEIFKDDKPVGKTITIPKFTYTEGDNNED